ncbi:MAG TPA: iron-sulfur cluster assembly scaffold protein [Thalassobaculum sp.]
MSDPLYQAEILELAKAGRAIGRLQSPTATARVDNPLCGDRVTIDLAIEDGRVTAIGAKVQGCALCQAAAAIIAAQAPGAATTDLRAAGEAVAVYLAGAAGEDALPWTRLSNFAPVRAVRSRHECVLLPFKAIARALAESEVPGGAAVSS